MSSSSRSSRVAFALPSAPGVPIPEVLKALIQFLASKKNEGVLWQYEDTTKSLTTIKSAEQIAIFLQHILRVFEVWYFFVAIGLKWRRIICSRLGTHRVNPPLSAYV